MPGEIPASPTSILKQAIKAVPAVKYALGVGGIVAVIAIVSSFGISANAAIFGTIIMLVLMVVLVVFASLVRKQGTPGSLPALVFTWFSLLLFMATAVLLFTSAFWAKPLDLKTFTSSSKPNPETSSPSQKSGDEPSPPQQKKSPERAEHEQVTSSPVDQEAHTWEMRGDKTASWAIVLEAALYTQPPQSPEELANRTEVALAGFKQARTAWTNAFNTAVTRRYKTALQTKLKSGNEEGLTCEMRDDDHIFCYPNGTEDDVIDFQDGTAPTSVEHIHKKP
jgi:energy-coupling factor transporter transmembrane protein EcfT